MKQRITISKNSATNTYHTNIEEYKDDKVWNVICVYESEKEVWAQSVALRLQYILSLEIIHLY